MITLLNIDRNSNGAKVTLSNGEVFELIEHGDMWAITNGKSISSGEGISLHWGKDEFETIEEAAHQLCWFINLENGG